MTHPYRPVIPRAPDPDPLDPVLERLTRLHPKEIDLTLGRVERLLARLGNPEARLPPVVHVAGTNGKGSVVAFLDAILRASGLRVHAYTSPHLVRFTERIRLAGSLISDAHLLQVLAVSEAANDGDPITFFEITTAAAFLAMAAVPADVVLLETGLGGRLDATNLVPRPAVTAITRISFDHREFLGDTLAAIAFEKAGIFRPGVPAVIAPQPAEAAAKTLHPRAEEVGAPITTYDVTALDNGGFWFRSATREGRFPEPGLVGPHQIENAGVALACLDHLPLPRVTDTVVAAGLQTVQWPGRLQRLAEGWLVDLVPRGWEVWLDGGHNDSAGEALAAQAARWQTESPDRLLLIIMGMLATKRPEEFVRPLALRVRALRAVPLPGPASCHPPSAIVDAAQALGVADAAEATDLAKAAAALGSRHPAPVRLLICGSLALVGAALATHPR